MTTNLAEEHRTKLDGIVQQMIGNKESEENIQWVVDDFKQKYTEQSEKEEPEMGLGEKLMSRVEKAIPPLPKTGLEVGAFQLEAATRAGGQLIGGIGDIVSSTLKTGYELTPESWQKNISTAGTMIKDLMGATSESITPEGLITKTGIEALQGIGESYQDFKQKHPKEATDIESLLNIASVAPVGKLVKPALVEGKAITKDIWHLARKKTMQEADDRVTYEVKKRMPAIMKGSNIKESMGKFDAKSIRASKNIWNNKENLKYVDEVGTEIGGGRMPENTYEGLQAVQQTKIAKFKEYNALKNMVEGEDAVTSVKPIVSKLRNLKKKNFIRRDKAIMNYIDKQIKFFEERAYLTLDDIQEEIAEINAKTSAFQRNPNPNLINNQAVEVTIADGMRNSIDDTITNAVGGDYAGLKQDYGSLLSIEKGFADAAKRNRVKAPGGALDLTDVLTGGTAIYAWSNMNAPLIAATMSAKALKTFHSWRVGTDHLTKKMFKEIDSVMSKSGEYIPKSKTGKRLVGERPRPTLRGEAKEQLKIGYEPKTKELPQGQGFTLLGEATTPPSFDIMGKPYTPFPKGRGQGLLEYKAPPQLEYKGTYKGKRPSIKEKAPVIKVKKMVTGDKLVDENIAIALQTPSILRTAEQKLIIDMIIRR